jgi:hypothetical protein
MVRHRGLARGSETPHSRTEGTHDATITASGRARPEASQRLARAPREVDEYCPVGVKIGRLARAPGDVDT